MAHFLEAVESALVEIKFPSHMTVAEFVDVS